MATLLGRSPDQPDVEIPWDEFVALRQYRVAVVAATETPGHVTKAELRDIEARFQTERTRGRT